LKALVTGLTGFIGRYLAENLVAKGHDVVGTTFLADGEPPMSGNGWGITTKPMDIRDKPMVERLVASTNPDVVYHLAGQAYVIPSYKNPEVTFGTNVLGTVNLLDAIKRYCPDCAVAVACSGAEYGTPKVLPIPEDHALLPLTPYGISKAAQDMVSYQYYANFGLRTYRLRLFGTTGPGKMGDVSNDFASQIALAETNGHPSMKVGNLSSSRDISDVRDVVEAMQIAVDRGEPGEAYNIGRGSAISVRTLLEKLLAMSETKIEVIVDNDRMRPSDEPLTYADTSKIRKLGWTPQISVEKTLTDLLEFWRTNSQPINSMAVA
jgi:GDP-4-dehydro-6-deoxy-D-mannose reductase